jgi:Tfp pilus assembly protein FimT
VGCGGECGTTLTELLVTVALVATVAGAGVPLVAHVRDAQDGRQAAQFLAGQLRAARQQAVLSGRRVGLVFDRVGDDWVFAVCADGDGDGVRRADRVSGTDTCTGPPQSLGSWFSRTTIDRNPTTPDLSGSTTGAVVAFGTSGIASFSPLGTSSSGSVTMVTRSGRHFAVRVAGVTGRIRILHFDSSTRRWLDGLP